MKAIETLINHAQETHPHFESIRGQKDIINADKELRKLKTVLKHARVTLTSNRVTHYWKLKMAVEACDNLTP